MSRRIRRSLVLAVLTVGAFAATGGSPAYATHCAYHHPSAPPSVTSAHSSGGLTTRATYNYQTCKAYGSITNSNGYGITGVDLKLWTINQTSCPSGGSNGLKLAEFAGSIGANTIKTISASTPSGSCIRVTFWLNGWPFDGAQVHARRY